jgi:hypothetical protein
MKYGILALMLLSFSAKVYAQNPTGNTTNPTTPTGQATTNEQTRGTDTRSTDTTNQQAQKVEFERPFNFFAAAGAAYMFNEQYSVAVSPVDNTIQFEKTYPILTRFSLGLVWNPLKDESASNKADYFNKKLYNDAYRAARNNMAIALLVNVFQLGYTAGEINTSSPIDVGFGLGYRNSNFLILGTLEFTPIRSPRTYFTDQFKDQNKTLVLAGAKEPVRTISLDDNSIFVNRVYPSIGIKIAYAFSKKPEGSGANR